MTQPAHPAPSGSWVRSETESADGTRLGVVSTGTGPPVVLVHGSLSDHLATWRGVAPRFADTMRVHAYDRRGRGLSGGATPGTLDDEADDLRSVVDAASADGGVCDVAVVAHSWGAHVALRAAPACHRINRIVAYEPPHPYPPERRAVLRKLIDAGDWDAFLRVFLRVPPERLDELRRSPRWADLLALAPSTGAEVRAFMDADLSPARFANVAVPVLVLVGERSDADRHDFLTRLTRWLPAGSIAMLAGHGHFAMREDSEAFLEPVRPFLDGGTAPGP